MYNRLNKFVNKIKKLLILLVSVSILLALAFPPIINLYIEKKYYTLSKNIAALNPNISITHNIQRKYLSSKIVSKIQTNNKLLVLQHDIKPIWFNKEKHIANIETKILSGSPGFLKQEKSIFALSTVNLHGDMYTKINPLNVEYIFDFDDISSIQALINVSINVKNKNLYLYVGIPKLHYIEDNTTADIDNIKFNIKIDNNIKLSTAVDRLYVVKDSKPILRLVDFYMKQQLTDINKIYSSLNSTMSFLKLNVYEQKFGPLATKGQITNIHLPTIVNNTSFPLNLKQFTNYNFMEVGNSLLRYRPTFALDMLIKTSSGKLKLLSDFSTSSSREIDLFNNEDLLDAIHANVAANIPKQIFFELARIILEEKLKRENINKIYSSIRKRGNMPNAVALKDSKEFQKQLDAMVVERVGYLLKNQIIKEHENNFILDISIAEGTFYSRMNPFKLFSFM